MCMLSFNDFTASEIKEIVAEMCLSELDRNIAILRFVDCMTIDEIAYKLGIDYRTCKVHIDRIKEKFNQTCIKFFS